MERVKNKRTKGIKILKLIDSFYMENLISKEVKNDCAAIIVEFMNSGDIRLVRDMADYLNIPDGRKKAIYTLVNE